MQLIIGGASSGKSEYAETLASAAGERVLYIAMAQVLDEEMAERVSHHRESRPKHWRTVETWHDLGNIITVKNDPQEVVLLECITTLASNVLFACTGEIPEEKWDYAIIETEINRRISLLIEACQRCPSPVFIVANEVGMGVVPENRMTRHFRDIAGRVNQRLAVAATDVWLVVSGVGMKIK